MRHNGYKNYDTWLVAVWLDNDEDNYNKAQRMDDDEIYELDKYDLEYQFYYGDDINFDAVDLDEIIDKLLYDE